jgi:hypothetical protein
VPHDDERELKRLLSEAHEALDPEPPAFAALLAAARRTADQRHDRRKARLRWTMAAAGGAAALIIGAYGLFVPRRASDGEAATTVRWAESLAEWRAPTDFLGRAPGAELLRELPTFGVVDTGLVDRRSHMGDADRTR